MNHSNPQNDGRLKYWNGQQSPTRFYAKIIVNQLKLSDTGFYLCRAVNHSDYPSTEIEPSISSNVYIFVAGKHLTFILLYFYELLLSDENYEHILLPWTINTLSIMSTGTQIIPCRSTIHDVKVTLSITGERQQTVVQESYNPRRVKVVHPLSLSLIVTWLNSAGSASR